MDCSEFGNIANESWILCNMFGTIIELDTDYSWFEFGVNVSDPCFWEFIDCRDDHITTIDLAPLDLSSSYFYEINTTILPPYLEILNIPRKYFSGDIDLTNLPNSTRSVNIADNWFTMDSFPDLSYATNLTNFYMSRCCEEVSQKKSFSMERLPYGISNVSLAGLSLSGSFDLGSDYSDKLSTLLEIEARSNDFSKVDFSGLPDRDTGIYTRVYLDDDTPCDSNVYCGNSEIPASDRLTEVSNKCFGLNQCEESCDCQPIFIDGGIAITDEFRFVCFFCCCSVR